MKTADRTFLISSGVSGLSLATARALDAQDAYVSLLDLNADNGSKITSELGSRARDSSKPTIENIDFVLNINLRGTLDLIRQALPYMTTATPSSPGGSRGVITMIASSAAFDGQMGQFAYAASKGAVVRLTLPLARDLSKYGIRAVTITPSMFDSTMTKMMSEKVRSSLEKSMEFPKRVGLPEEFARLVVECVGNEMLNGTVLRLGGAMRMPARL